MKTIAISLMVVLASACGGDDGGPIEIAGSWSSDFGAEEIGTDTWGTATVVMFDNDENFTILQNPPDAEYDPDKYNKVVWTEPTTEGFYYCWIDIGLDSAEAAENSTKTADASDPTSGGCGDWPWTKLSPAE